MKKFFLLVVLALLLGLAGCSAPAETPQILATTKPVYDIIRHLCADTNLSVGLLISENVSCLHDYSLSVEQVRNAEDAEVIVLSGAGLEDFMSDLLSHCGTVIDSSVGISLLDCTAEHEHDHNHHHETDAHIWLSPKNALQMAENICDGLIKTYPQYADNFRMNLAQWEIALEALQAHGEQELSSLSCREMVTFHDGFSYFAQAFNLTIVAAIEEESGSEASAKELIHLIELIREQNIPAVFTEISGSPSAANIICSELGISGFSLNMCMNLDSDYIQSMYENIKTVKEALE